MMTNFGTKEWADSNVNCCTGCSNNCRYCYAKKMAIRFGRATKETWPIMKIRSEDVETDYNKRDGRIMFPTSHDITPEVKDACFTVLNKLLEAGNEVLITTKPRLEIIQEICSLFFNFKDQIQFRFTITSANDELLEFWEPGAPNLIERIKSLNLAFALGYKTSVSIEPFLDAIPEFLVYMIYEQVTESIWIGKMNHISRQYESEEEKIRYKILRNNYSDSNLLRTYRVLKTTPKVRFKDKTLLKMKKLYQEYLDQKKIKKLDAYIGGV